MNIEELTEAQEFWRAEVKRAKHEGRLAPDAQEIASRRLRARYPQYKGKSTKTIAQKKPMPGGEDDGL